MLPYCCTQSFMEHSFCIQTLYSNGVEKEAILVLTCGKEVECIWKPFWLHCRVTASTFILAAVREISLLAVLCWFGCFFKVTNFETVWIRFSATVNVYSVVVRNAHYWKVWEASLLCTASGDSLAPPASDSDQESNIMHWHLLWINWSLSVAWKKRFSRRTIWGWS